MTDEDLIEMEKIVVNLSKIAKSVEVQVKDGKFIKISNIDNESKLTHKSQNIVNVNFSLSIDQTFQQIVEDVNRDYDDQNEREEIINKLEILEKEIGRKRKDKIQDVLTWLKDNYEMIYYKLTPIISTLFASNVI